MTAAGCIKRERKGLISYDVGPFFSDYQALVSYGGSAGWLDSAYVMGQTAARAGEPKEAVGI